MKSKLILGLLAVALIFGPALAQSPTPHGVLLTWNASTTAGVSYVVFRCPGTCTSASTAWTALFTGTIPGLSYIDPASNLAASTTYSYEVDAVDANGNYSGPSNTATATLPAVLPTNPAPPSGCAAKVQ